MTLEFTGICPACTRVCYFASARGFGYLHYACYCGEIFQVKEAPDVTRLSPEQSAYAVAQPQPTAAA